MNQDLSDAIKEFFQALTTTVRKVNQILDKELERKGE